MKKSLLITGASGFIGTNLLQKIDLQEFRYVFCLGRSEMNEVCQLKSKDNLKFVKGDISDPKSYKGCLRSVDIVVHLAALTGKGEAGEFFRINSEGTRILLEQSKRNNVGKVILISSIAAGFKNVEGYHYAQSKIEAENHVRKSGIGYTILRPTMVIGSDSPILKSMLQLAKAPVVPIFGNGRARIQPVYVDDLVNCILNALRNDSLTGQCVTVAGPEQISVEDFIRILHNMTYGKRLRIVHLPVTPIKRILGYLEKKYLAYLPFTAGQLCSFTSDGVADTNPCFDSDVKSVRGIEEMLRLSLLPRKDKVLDYGYLKQESILFTRYLIGTEPDSYIKQKYILGHEKTAVEKDIGCFDSLLLKWANRNRLFLKLADTYTSVFYKDAVIRKKLLLLLAILECCESTYEKVDKMNESPTGIVVLQLAQKAIFFIFTLIAAFIILAPLRLLARSKTNKATA